MDRRKGFTIIELTVVLIIISVLSSVGIVNYRRAQTLAEVARLQVAIHNLELAVGQALLDGANPHLPTAIDASNVDQSILKDYLTAATFGDTPDGLTLSVSAGNQASGDRSGWDIRISLRAASDAPAAQAIIQAYHERHPRTTWQAGTAYVWSSYNSADLAEVTTDDLSGN